MSELHSASSCPWRLATGSAARSSTFANAQIAAALGANPLFVVEINPDRLSMALRIVPQAVWLNTTEDDIAEAVHTATGAHGVDV